MQKWPIGMGAFAFAVCQKVPAQLTFRDKANHR